MKIERTGLPTSPASALVTIGIVSGIAAALLLLSYLVVADFVVSDFSNLKHLMSDLGDSHGARTGQVFEFMQYATALLLALFTYAFVRMVPSSRFIAIALMTIVVFTAALGQARIRPGKDCSGPTLKLLPFLYKQHNLVTGVLAAAILLVLVLTVTDLRRTGPYRVLALSGAPLLGIYAISALAYYATRGEDHFHGLAERGLWVAGYGWTTIASVLMFRHRHSRRLQQFDVTRLQENIVFGSSKWCRGLYETYNLTDVEGFRQWLRDALEGGLIRPEQPRVPSPLVPDRGFAVTLALSHHGLQALGIDYRWNMPGIDDPFGSGMAARFALLGDSDDAKALDSDHVLLWVVAASDYDLRAARTNLNGLTRVARRNYSYTASTEGLPARTEPFGWVDGISNPWLRGVHDPADLSRAGGGKITNRGFQQIALGEFILGEVDEADDTLPLPDPPELFRHGTFLVVRRLAQDSSRFDTVVKSLARSLSVTDDEAGAKLVGRLKDGTGLASVDERFGSSDNHFLYGDDPEGLRCPVGAHIRRANPRDSLGFDGVPTHRRRIIRRGMPYRERLPGGPGEEGLMFLCLNARPAEQFEFIQTAWLNDGEAIRLGRTPDPIAGNWTGERLIPVPGDDGPTFVRLIRSLVTTRSGGYFFVPSIAGLRYVARG